MRVFDTLQQAALEIRRDLAKGTQMDFSRVQQHVGVSLPGRERTSYEYTVRGEGFPASQFDLVRLGAEMGFKPFKEHPQEMGWWLDHELDQRIHPGSYLGCQPSELSNPLLRSTVEGNFFSYTYRERLLGMKESLLAALMKSPDSRRAFWPIFRPEDAIRASEATRIPCSLGYEAMLRQVDGKTKLMFFYLQRSCDFDRFWLSDIWMAAQIGGYLARELGTELGAVHHYILSLHSFETDLQEIY